MKPIHLAMACDERYVMPLAVSVRSVLENLPPHQSLRLTIISEDISARQKQTCLDSWRGFDLECQWVVPELQFLENVPTTDLLPLPTYYRFLLPDILPDCSRVIYLDVDTLVLRSIESLWETPFGSNAIAAAQDLACPMIHFRSELENYEIAYRYLLRKDPIPNYQELGLPPSAPYFNAGVMVMNLDLWRSESLGHRLAHFAVENAKHNVSADQYALNGCLWNRCKFLDPRWNQLQAIYAFPSWRESIFDKESFRRVRNDPWIAHFAGPGKPWESGSRNPLCEKYFECLDRTAFRGWRPKPLEENFQKRSRRLWRRLRDAVGARWRRLNYMTSALSRN